MKWFPHRQLNSITILSINKNTQYKNLKNKYIKKKVKKTPNFFLPYCECMHSLFNSNIVKGV